MVRSRTQQFPAVTLCNTNTFRRSALGESSYKDLLLLDRPGALSNLMPYKGPCFEGDFSCGESTTECVKRYMKCNGVEECSNAADEDNCSGGPAPVSDDDEPCALDNTFQCNNSRCISSELTCDFIDNCGDFSDEEKCTYLEDCSGDSFTCDNSGGQCIPRYLQCDRVRNCRNGEDENNCEYSTKTGDGPTDVFPDDWTQAYQNITKVERHYDDFREKVYKPKPMPSLIPLLLASTSPAFDDVRDALAVTKEEMRVLGHQQDDAILKCSYNGMECGSGAFTISQHRRYGNCFTFNGDASAAMKAAKPGPAHGLKLLLSAQQNEHVGIYGGETGFKVVIHAQGVMPLPELNGFYASPGTFTSVAVEKISAIRLPEPYGSACSTEYRPVEECEAMCLSRYMEDYCGCSNVLMATETAPCDKANPKQDMCRQLMAHFSALGVLTCHCAPPCSETQYKPTITQTAWPSTKYVPHLLNSLHHTNNKTWMLIDEMDVKANLVSLEVYFNDFTATLVEQKPVYTVMTFMMDLGAVLATWMSLALLLVVIVYICCCRALSGKSGKASRYQ
ncbi:acid-sensing ion channel 1-like [Ptychodera flava]|uniref:acid-sensing ion channel 1-like n=1 Tax=Ptychodera flava TaxID=63121 RepID=UPI00396A4464